MKNDIPFLLPAVPRSMTRRGRIELIAEGAQAMRDGRPVPPEAAAYLSTALLSWLSEPGDLTRDFFKTKCDPGSHRTEQAIYAECVRAREHGEDEE